MTRALRLASALGVLLALLIVAATALPRGADTQSLAGVWQGVSRNADGESPTSVSLPALVDGESTWILKKEVDVPGEGPWAIWFGQIRGRHAELWIDGVLAGESSYGGALVATAAGKEGPHRLELHLEGDGSPLGVIGDVVVGPVGEVTGAALRQQTSQLGFALGLSVIGLASLALAVGRGVRPIHAIFGWFVLAMALYAWAHADQGVWLPHDPTARERVSRLAQGGAIALALAFNASFVGRWGWWPARGLAIASGLSALLALAIPASGLHGVEIAQDLFAALGAVVGIVMLGRAAGAGVPGAKVVLLSLVPIGIGLPVEILRTQGLANLGPVIWFTLALYVAGLAAAVLEQDAAESERYRRLVSGSSDAILLMEPDGSTLASNPAAEALLGPTRLEEAVIAEDREALRATIQRGAERPLRGDFRILVEGMERVLEAIATPMEGGAVMMVLRDVTARRKQDQGLLQAARMETASLLLGGIAHDFNNLLGVLVANVGMLQATIQEEGSLARLAKMEKAIDRGSILARRLMAVSGGGQGRLAPMELAPVLRNAAELLEPTLGTRKIELDLPPDLPQVMGSAGDLEQVFLNLLVNARDAMGGREGPIRMVARPFSLSNGATGVVVIVEDAGPGVPEAIAEEIWTPFYTTKGRRGTGLGLPVARQVMRDHHGRIWHEPRPGGGARFAVALRPAEEDTPGEAALPRGRRVLVAEDEPVMLDGLSAALRQAGYEVRAAASGEEARDILLSWSPDCLVTDVVMPGMSGLELARTCQQIHPDCCVLVVSGFIPDDEPLQPGWARLDKPVRLGRVVEAVAQLRNRKEGAAAQPALTRPGLEGLTLASVLDEATS